MNRWNRLRWWLSRLAPAKALQPNGLKPARLAAGSTAQGRAKRRPGLQAYTNKPCKGATARNPAMAYQSHTYRSSYSISCFVRSARNSSWKVIFRWCFSWLAMYFRTAGTLDWLTEKAP